MIAPGATLLAIRRLSVFAGMPMVGLSLLENLNMDVDKIEKAAKLWRNAARALDRPVETLDGLPAAARRGWIADDQREFSRVTGHMHTSTEELRDALDKMGEILETTVFAFRVFGKAMAGLGVTISAASVYALTMMLTSPYTARVYLRYLASAADKVLTGMCAVLITYVMGQATALAIVATEAQQMGEMAKTLLDPNGFSRAELREVDFSSVKINTKKFPTFTNLESDQKVPDDFWVAPKPKTSP
ncbi:WXG100 family type VII secretion target [Nonomuraea sp. NPDC049269]|uniref:WXG100 family type VII secretion target n=1 Tax=Nonomuraea sp. NPDC049269 TaxID=3364349 RepID=UPI00372419B9